MNKLVATLSLLLVIGVPLAIHNIQTLYAWFPGLKPALANAIDVVTGYVPPSGPSLRVTHECRYLDPSASECWKYLKIVSLNEQPVTIQDVIVNGRKECTADRGLLQGLATIMAAQFINVSNKTIKKGDAYGVGVTCEPVDVAIVTDKGAWKGGSEDR
jgi:hypothetical protein